MTRQPLSERTAAGQRAHQMGTLLPPMDPVAAQRLACYVGGLLCFAGVYVCEQLWLHHQRAILAVGQSAFLVAGIALFFLACRSTLSQAMWRRLPSGRTVLGTSLLATLVLAVAGLGLITQAPRNFGTPHHWQLDNIAMNDCGIQLFWHGQNPYTAFSLTGCLTQNGLSGDAATPLQAGAFARDTDEPTSQQLVRAFQQAARRHVRWPAEFESHFSYPAASFIVPAPFMALSGDQLGIFYLLCLVLAYVFLAWWAPGRLRPWVVVLGLANITIWANTGGFAPDSLDVLLMLVGWATWRRSWVSALLMGLAVATRQNAWFIVPFYAILVGRTFGWRTLAQRLAVMAAVFALVNGPFFLQSPAAWVDGVLGTLRDPMYSIGIGVIALVRHGLLPLWPRPAYSVLELVAVAACALYYARTCRRQPGTGLALAFVPFLVAWRSSFVYFLPLAILCLWPLLDDLRSATAGHALPGSIGIA